MPYEVALPQGWRVSDDKALLDLDLIHRFLSEQSYWAAGITRPVFERSIAGSLCFGLYDRTASQAGFARAISDHATFAWLGDVFVLPDHRGLGLGHRLVAAVLAHPELQGLRRWMLATRDAHALYARFGFAVPAEPGRLMLRQAPAGRSP